MKNYYLETLSYTLHSKIRTTCSGLMETALNNVVLPTLFNVVNDIVQSVAEIQFKRWGGGQSSPNFRQICFDFAYFFSFFNKHGKHGNDHIEKYFQNLHGKASKFLDFPQHSINWYLPVFKNRSTQNWDRSSIKAALRYIRQQQA